MKKFTLLWILVVSFALLQADPPGYYDSVSGLTGDALKNGLHSIISTNNNSSYTGAKEEMFGYIDNNSGLVRCVYTGQDYNVSPGGMPNQTYLNCEHTFAQSWFGSSESSIKRADIHHLFPTNSNVNSSRGNLPFDNVTSVGNTYTYANGYVSKRGANMNGTTCFEPADQHKGNVARALLYFHVRYNESLTRGGINMVNTLLEWHVSDPVDVAEQQRNEGIYSYQNNRNPFVDHPEFIDYIWGTTSPNTVIQYSMSSITLPESYDSINVNLTIVNPGDEQTTVEAYLVSGDANDVDGFNTQIITFPADSEDAQVINIGITDDDLVEGTETIVFGLRNFDGPNTPGPGPISTFSLTITDDDMPTPTLLSPSNVESNSFTAQWDITSSVDAYSFELANDEAFTSYVTGYSGFVTNDQFLNVSGLYPDHTYFYRVRALHNNTYSDFSNTMSVTTEAGSMYFTTDLFISEYIEGSSYNKAIEIYNGTGMAVDLSQYSLEKDVNGGNEFGNTYDFTGMLGHNEVYVIANSQSSQDIIDEADVTSNGVINFNGNDQIRLLKNGVEIDRIGIAGDANFAQNVTLVRKLHINAPQSGQADPQNNGEWDIYDSDDFSHLGFHLFAGVSNEEITQPVVSNITMNTYPNPFSGNSILSLNTKSSLENAKICVYNVKGQLVESIFSGRINKGTNEIEWSTNLKSGIYFIRLQSNSASITSKAVIIK